MGKATRKDYAQAPRRQQSTHVTIVAERAILGETARPKGVEKRAKALENHPEVKREVEAKDLEAANLEEKGRCTRQEKADSTEVIKDNKDMDI